MIQIDKIKRTFLTDRDCPGGMACLASIVRFYDERFPLSVFVSDRQPDYTVTLQHLKELAHGLEFEAEIHLYSLNRLEKLCTPAILFTENELGENEFVVYYGMYNGRFVVGEPSFGLMQYLPQEINAMWIRGIILTLFPLSVFLPQRDRL